MVRRWVFFLALLVLLTPFSAAHKFPIIEYSYIGHTWEAAYTTIPRQPVVDETITLKVGVDHPGSNPEWTKSEIEGNVTVFFSVYRDDTRYEWYGGKSYKRPDWLLIHNAGGTPIGNNEFTTGLVIGEPGSYVVTVDYYEDEQYMGQSMHTLDVETRTLGPLFLSMSAVIIGAVLLGVRKGVL